MDIDSASDTDTASVVGTETTETSRDDHVFKVPGLPVPKSNGATARLGNGNAGGTTQLLQQHQGHEPIRRTNTLTSSSGYTDTASTTSSKREARDLVDFDDSTLNSEEETTDDESRHGHQERALGILAAKEGKDGPGTGLGSPSAAKKRREIYHRDYQDDEEDDDDEDGALVSSAVDRLHGRRSTTIDSLDLQDDGDRPDDFFPLPLVGNDPRAGEFLVNMFLRAQKDIEKSSFCSMKFDAARHRFKLWGSVAQIRDAIRSLQGVGRECLIEIEHRSRHAIEVPHQRIGRAETAFQAQVRERRERRLEQKKKWLSQEESDFRKMPVIGVFEWPGSVNPRVHFGSDLKALAPICITCEVYLRYEGSAEGGPLYVYGQTEASVKEALVRLEFCYLRILHKNNLETFAKSNAKHLLRIFSTDSAPFVLEQIFPEEKKGRMALQGCPQPTMIRCFRANAPARLETLQQPAVQNGPLEIEVSRPTEADRTAARLVSAEPDDDLDIELFQEGLTEIVSSNYRKLKKTLLTGLGYVNMLHGPISMKFTIGAGVLRSWPSKGLGGNIERANAQLSKSQMMSEVREAIVLTENSAFTILADLDAKKRKSGEIAHKTLLEVNAARSSIFQPTSKDRQAKRPKGYMSVILEVKFNQDGSIATWSASEDHLRVAEINALAIDSKPALSWSASVDFAQAAPTKPDDCTYEPFVKSMTSPVALQDPHVSGMSTAREVRFRNPNGGELRLGVVERQQVYSYWWNDESPLVLDVVYHEVWDCSDLAKGRVAGFEVRLLPAPQVGSVQVNVDKNRPVRNYWSFEARMPDLASKLAENNALGNSKPGIRPSWRATSEDIFGERGVVSLVQDIEEMIDYLAAKGVHCFQDSKKP